MDIMDNIQLKQAEDATQEDHNHTAACDVAVSSAPYPGATAADAYGGNGPSQQEVSRPPRPAPAQVGAAGLASGLGWGGCRSGPPRL